MTREWLKENTVDIADFSMDYIPVCSDRKIWDSISEKAADFRIKAAEKYLNYEFKGISATDFMLFKRIGNRSVYEKISFEKREALTALVLGECVENKGRFLDSIVNGIWSVCEESFWGIPAHNDGFTLPDIKRPIIDLFAAQSANLLTLTLYLLKDKLGEVTELLEKRILFELKRRIIEPFKERKDFWWMGYERRDLNNWTPWILSNLAPLFIMEKEQECLEKAIYIIDGYLNTFDENGSCDEGITYWNHGGLSLFDFFETLLLSSKGKIDFFSLMKSHGIFTFAEKMYIGGGHFVNFADASPFPNMEALSVYRMGKRIKSESTMNFAAVLFKNQSEKTIGEYNTLRRGIFDTFVFDEISAFPQKENKADFSRILPDIQIFTARQQDSFVAIKGGSNGENHNHNDVGSFIFCKNDKPLLIDMGAAVYDARSFTSERYQIFAHQSSYHNLPDINSKAQKEGADSRAENFSATENQVSMELSSCYEGEKFSRHFLFEKGRLFVKDSFDNASVCSNFITAEKPEIIEGGVSLADTKLFCKEEARIEIETISLTDERLRHCWGDKLYRIRFRKENATQMNFEIG